MCDWPAAAPLVFLSIRCAQGLVSMRKNGNGSSDVVDWGHLHPLGQKAPRLQPGDEWPSSLAGFSPLCEHTG
jgi:hypothetical protein